MKKNTLNVIYFFSPSPSICTCLGAGPVSKLGLSLARITSPSNYSSSSYCPTHPPCAQSLVFGSGEHCLPACKMRVSRTLTKSTNSPYHYILLLFTHILLYLSTVQSSARPSYVQAFSVHAQNCRVEAETVESRWAA